MTANHSCVRLAAADM